VAGDARSEERRWWRLSLAYLAAIYLSLYPLQFVLDFLRARNLLRLSLAALFVAAAAAVAVWMRRRGARRLEWLALAGIGAVYAALLERMTIVQERLHLLEYGLLALGFRAALEARRRRGAPTGGAAGVAAGAWLLTALAGWLDEGIQGLLPNRVYDLRDVGFNALAGALALASAAALEAARRRARRGDWIPARL
jgi:hypothetical protein